MDKFSQDNNNDLCDLGSCHFNNNFNCCESVLLAAAQHLDIDSSLIPRIATPFGAGISQRRYMCGALSGAVMAIGLKYGRDSCTQERNPATDRANAFVNRFLDKYGTVNCIELLGIDLNDPEFDNKKKQAKDTICSPLVKQVCQWLKKEI
jgi:C_GCAxxG_C_C family probable redox protein